MKRHICLLGLVLALGLVLGSEAKSAVVVSWGGDYVSTNTLLEDTAGDYTVPGVGLWEYNQTTRSSPTTGYTPPVGRSGTFYWGGYTVRSDGAGNPSQRNWTLDQVTQGSGGDSIAFSRGNSSSDYSISGAVFLSFIKGDFLDGFDALPVAFDLASSLDVTTNVSVSATYRFAALADGQWYLSEAFRTTPGTLSLSGQNLLDSLWGAWSPTGGADDRLGDVPEVFDVVGSSFSDIQGFGVYTGFDAGLSSSMQIGVTDFTVTIPEPSTLAFLVVSAGFGIIGLHRRRTTR